MIAVTMMARPFDFFSHSKKASEKTKNGHVIIKPHVGSNNECRTPYVTADTIAIFVGAVMNRLRNHNSGHIKSVSTQGDKINAPNTTRVTGPFKEGPWTGIATVTAAEITRLGISAIKAAFQT